MLRQMWRRLAASLLLSLAALAVRGQNNPYGIDDGCYRFMQEADALIGKPGFEEANSRLLQEALIKEDRKAQVLYYVESMRDRCRRKDSDEKSVLEAHERLKSMSKDFGYYQYYYQSYQFLKNWYFNRGQTIKALDAIREMQSVAVDEGNEYGKWFSEKELVAFYLTYGALRTAREHLRVLINEYEKSSDPLVRRQSLCPFYLDYASTFSPDLDSVGIYIDKAWETVKAPVDSVKCLRESAKLAAVRGRTADYKRYRDLALGSPHKQGLGWGTVELFEVIDALLDGSFVRKTKISPKIMGHNLRVLSCIAETLGRPWVSLDLKDKCLTAMDSDISDLIDMNLAELEVRYGNDVLTADLAQKSRQVQRTTRIIALLLLLILLGVVTGLFLNNRHLQAAKARDEKMIEELTAANEQVRHANEAKIRFVQNMSHEVRTPLNAIVGFSQLLSLPDGTFPESEKKEFSSHIVNNTKMLTMLLDDILNASAMDSGSYKISYGQGECGFIAQAAISSSEHRLQPGVTMRYIPGFEGQHLFRTDPQRVQQILINLLTNACKHTSSGEIRLGCSLTENPGEVTFSVEDTGPGVPAAQAEAIFERFKKLDEFVQGTGLGLSICREIAGKMDGRVFLDTSYTGGARFVLVLPDKAGPLAE